MTYYRLYDNQCSTFMATGYNATSKKDLFEQYASYKSADWDEDEQQKCWDKEMSETDKWDFIVSDDFEIEESKQPFGEVKGNYWHAL